jgi:hypothetical protein
MARDLGDLAASVSRMPAAIRQAEATGVQKATIRTTGLIRDQIRSATGDMRLSGVGKKGARVGARYDKHFAATPDAPAMEIKATGPLHLIERDTRAHLILPRGQTFTARGSRRSGRKALKIGDDFRLYAEHPGTRGKRPFARGVARAAPEVPRIIQAEVGKTMMRSWL